MDEKSLFTKAHSFIIERGTYPTLADLKELGISRDQVKRHFGNLNILKGQLYSVCSGEIFDLEREEFNAETKRCRRLVITTAVTGAKVNVKFYNALKSFCKNKQAELLILPSSTTPNSWLMDPMLKNETFIVADTVLNKRLTILGIKNSAKSVDPITGLPRVGQRNGSFISASPKQRLKFVATGTDTLPHALMSTGAITVADYKHKGLLIDKSTYLANNDHVMGAIVIELDDNNVFHFRQVQCDKDGAFADLGVLYTHDKKPQTYAPKAFVIGDYHSGETDRQAEKTWLDITKKLKIDTWVIHDGFNASSISHHDQGRYATLAKKSIINKLSLKDELDAYGTDLKNLLKTVNNLVIVKSNHDEHLERYLNEARYHKEPQNHRFSLDLASAYIDGHNPLKYYMKKIGISTGVNWLDSDESYMIAGIELGAHGDNGANGARGSTKSIEEAYGDSVSGHSHTPEILRGAWRVGTSSKLRLDYNAGPSSWFHTSCLVYPNGQRQLINSIQGKWTINK